MLSSIHPLGERARRNRWGVTVAAYLVGSTLGGLAVGAAVGAVGAPIPLGRLSLPLAAALALAAAAIEAGRLPLRLPSPRRQVDEAWLDTYRGWVYGAGFGVQLGAGFTTFVTTPAVHLAFALALLTGSATGGALIGAAFGLARALPILATRTLHDPERLRAFHRRLVRQDAPVRRAAVVVLAATGIALLITAGGGFAHG